VTAPILLFGVFLASLPLVPRDPVKPTWDRRAVIGLVAYAVSNAINVLAFFSAMSTTSVAVAVLTHSLAPVIVAVLAPFVDHTRSARALPAALLATAGLTLVLEPWRPEARTGDVLLGAGLGGLSAIAYATCVFMLGPLAQRVGAVRVMGYHSAIAAVLILPFAGARMLDVELRDLLPLGAAVILPGIVAGLAFVHALRILGPARTAVLALLEPVVACVIGWAVWGEPLGALAIVGAAMVIGAAALVAGDRAEKASERA